MLGPPGAGKGTQGELLCQELGLVHVSTGDILRDAVARGTELGKLAKKYMDAGDLVPDEVVIGIVRERLAQDDARSRGVLLDGFPRTVPQAEALEGILEELGYQKPLVVDMVVPDDEVVRRLSTRRVCRQCGAIYNVERDKLDVGDRCPKCGGEIYQRDDDRPEAIRERLKVYYEQTAPLIDYYRQRSNMVEVNCVGSVEEVHSRLVEAVRERIGV